MQEENILIQAGLSQEQALIYQALLDRGPQKASDISKWTGIKRGLIYKVLEQLESMGLLSKKGGPGTVAVFSPLHPSLLLSNIERKEKELALTKGVLESSLGNLSSKYNLITGKPNVQFFEGENAIEKITGDYPKEEKEIRQCIDISVALKNMGKETTSYLNERVKKGISKKMLVSDSVENRDYAKNGSPLTEFGIVKRKFPTVIQIYDSTVSMLTLTEEKQIGLIIEDQAVSETLKNIFDELWEKSEKVSSDSEKQ